MENVYANHVYAISFKVKKWIFSIKRAKNDDFKGDKIICI